MGLDTICPIYALNNIYLYSFIYDNVLTYIRSTPNIPHIWSTSTTANAFNISHHPLCQAHPTCTTRPWSSSRSSKRNCSSRWINNCRTYAIWRKLPEWIYAIWFDQIVILVNRTSKWFISLKIILKVAFVGHHLDQVIGRLEASAGKYLVREKINSVPQMSKRKKENLLKLY